MGRRRQDPELFLVGKGKELVKEGKSFFSRGGGGGGGGGDLIKEKEDRHWRRNPR